MTTKLKCRATDGYKSCGKRFKLVLNSFNQLKCHSQSSADKSINLVVCFVGSNNDERSPSSQLTIDRVDTFIAAVKWSFFPEYHVISKAEVFEVTNSGHSNNFSQKHQAPFIYYQSE